MCEREMCEREAFDLHNSYCRDIVWYKLRYGGGWRKLWFLKLVFEDTWNNVCQTKIKNKEDE